MRISFNVLVLTFVIFSLELFGKCVPKDYNFNDFVFFREEEMRLTCSPLKSGDLIERCSGEVCNYLDYPKAVKDVKLHAKPDLQSPIIGEVKRCDVIKDFNVVSVFKEYGKIEAATDLPGYGLKKGDQFNFTWTQEGEYYGCINGNTVVVYASPEKDLSQSCFYHVKDSELEQWVRHTASNGKTGYSKVEANPFYIPYAGREESLLCPEDRIKKKKKWHPPLPKPPVGPKIE